MAETEKKTRRTAAKAKEKNLTLEEAFASIEEIIGKLEAEELSLEESIKRYQEGMELLQYCNANVDAVEKKVLKWNENGELDEF